MYKLFALVTILFSISIQARQVSLKTCNDIIDDIVGHSIDISDLEKKVEEIDEKNKIDIRDLEKKIEEVEKLKTTVTNQPQIEEIEKVIKFNKNKIKMLNGIDQMNIRIQEGNIRSAKRLLDSKHEDLVFDCFKDDIKN